MNYDKEKVDDAVLALLFLTLHDYQGRAWKGHDWDSLGRLHEKGMILNPVDKSKSVMLTEEGMKRSEELFREHFGVRDYCELFETTSTDAGFEKQAAPCRYHRPPNFTDEPRR